jgi:hypothetical protein
VTQEIEQPEKVIRTVRLDTRFTPEARERIVKFMQSFVSFKPVLGLLYGDVPADGSAKGTWSIAALGQQTVDDLIEMYAGFGAVICYDIDDIQVVVPQIGHINELETGVLEFSGDRLRLIPSGPE